MDNFVNFASSEPCCLKFVCWFKQQNFLLRPTQLVDENKENFNAQFKTQKNVVLNN